MAEHSDERTVDDIAAYLRRQRESPATEDTIAITGLSASMERCLLGDDDPECLTLTLSCAGQRYLGAVLEDPEGWGVVLLNLDTGRVAPETGMVFHTHASATLALIKFAIDYALGPLERA